MMPEILRSRSNSSISSSNSNNNNSDIDCNNSIESDNDNSIDGDNGLLLVNHHVPLDLLQQQQLPPQPSVVEVVRVDLILGQIEPHHAPPKVAWTCQSLRALIHAVGSLNYPVDVIKNLRDATRFGPGRGRGNAKYHNCVPRGTAGWRPDRAAERRRRTAGYRNSYRHYMLQFTLANGVVYIMEKLTWCVKLYVGQSDRVNQNVVWSIDLAAAAAANNDDEKTREATATTDSSSSTTTASASAGASRTANEESASSTSSSLLPPVFTFANVLAFYETEKDIPYHWAESNCKHLAWRFLTQLLLGSGQVGGARNGCGSASSSRVSLDDHDDDNVADTDANTATAQEEQEVEEEPTITLRGPLEVGEQLYTLRSYVQFRNVTQHVDFAMQRRGRKGSRKTALTAVHNNKATITKTTARATRTTSTTTSFVNPKILARKDSTGTTATTVSGADSVASTDSLVASLEEEEEEEQEMVLQVVVP